MTTQAVSGAREGAKVQASWLVIIADFNTTPSSISTALVVYSLAVAGFVSSACPPGQFKACRSGY